RLLVVKARLIVALGRIADVARSFETGSSFGRPLSQGRFLICRLVGDACPSPFPQRFIDFHERLGSPTLYLLHAGLHAPAVCLRPARVPSVAPLPFGVLPRAARRDLQVGLLALPGDPFRGSRGAGAIDIGPRHGTGATGEAAAGGDSQGDGRSGAARPPDSHAA